MKRTKWVQLLVASFVIHCLFSWIGYNPTDDGFVLATSKRLLNGYFPHRDFISIRPVGSGLLHLPFLFLGDYCIWVSRYFIILQWMIISATSLSLIQKIIKPVLSGFEEYVWFVVILTCGLHHFPLLPWTTVDGIFLSIIGFNLLYAQRAISNYLGLFLIGFSVLTKQVYVPLLCIPFFIPLKISKVATLVVFVPALLYGIVVWLNGGLNHMIVQFLARSEFVQTGIVSYFKIATFLGIGYVMCTPIILKRANIPLQKFFMVMPIIGYLIVAVIATDHIYGYSFFPFGISIALLVYAIVKKEYLNIQLLLIVLAIAWTASVSIGYNFPVFFTGVLICCNFFILKQLTAEVLSFQKMQPVLLCFVVAVFFYLRIFFPYRDQPAFNLNYSLSGVLKGARFIHTNPTTFAYLSEVNVLAKEAAFAHKQIAIIPGFPGYWIGSENSNVLKADWANQYEVQGALLDSVCSSLDQNKKSTWILIDKFETKHFKTGLIKLTSGYGSVDYVMRKGHCIKKGTYIDIYELY